VFGNLFAAHANNEQRPRIPAARALSKDHLVASRACASLSSEWRKTRRPLSIGLTSAAAGNPVELGEAHGVDVDLTEVTLVAKGARIAPPLRQ